MQTVTSYSPVLGQSEVVNLLYQSGYTEVINDTNHSLFVQLNTGLTLLPPGVMQMYPTPEGGGTITIQTQAQFTYTNMDQGSCNTITVNQYLPDEIIGKAYPIFLARSVQISDNFFPIISSVFGVISGGLTAQCNDPAATPNGQLYLWGWDLSIDAESSSHALQVKVHGLIGGLSWGYYYRTSTTQSIDVAKRYDKPIASAGTGIPISVQFSAVSGGAANAVLTCFCEYR